MKILVFNDYCCVGHCALKVNISILTQNGCEVFAIPTKIFSSHMAYKDFLSFEMPKFSEIFEKVKKIQKFDAVYIGFIDNVEQFYTILNFLKNFKGKVILDTILGDNGLKYSGTSEKQIQLYREFIKFSDVITPNLTEAILLTDYEKNISEIEKDDVETIGEKLLDIGAKSVLIKGFEKGNMLNTIYFSKDIKMWYDIKKIDIKICGTGDVFSSLVACELLNGKRLENSISKIQNLLFKNISIQEKFEGLNDIKLENFKI